MFCDLNKLKSQNRLNATHSEEWTIVTVRLDGNSDLNSDLCKHVP